MQTIFGKQIKEDIKLSPDIEFVLDDEKVYCNHVPLECLIIEEDTLNKQDYAKKEKNLKGYIFDSLVYRYKNAREKLAYYEAKADCDNLTKYNSLAQRDVMRFCQILNEVIGEHT